MRRRRLLALLSGAASSLAGCSGVGSLADGSDAPDRDAPEETLTPAPVPAVPTEDPWRNPSGVDDRPGPFPDVAPVADVDPLDRRVPTPVRRHGFASLEPLGGDGPVARLQLGFVRGGTADRPALLRGRLLNESLRRISVPLENLPLFDGAPIAVHDDSSARIAFAPTLADGLASSVPEVDRTGQGTWRVPTDDLGSAYPRTVDLGPHEARRVELRALPLAEGARLPAGTYRFGSDGPGAPLEVWDPSVPGPAEAPALTGASPPSLPGFETVRWYHEAGTETAAWLGPSAERVGLPASLPVELVNHSTDPIETGGAGLDVYKLVDGDWYWLSTVPWEEPAINGGRREPLWPGRRQRVTLCLAHEPDADCSATETAAGSDDTAGGDGNEVTLEYDGNETTDGDDILSETTVSDGELVLPLARESSVGPLGGGRYALAVRVADGAHAALVDVDAPTLTVSAADDVRVTERTDGTVVLDHQSRHVSQITGPTLVVERASDADRRLIAEQAMGGRYRNLGSALAHFESGVHRVELRDAGFSLDATPLFDGGEAPFRFRGRAYRAVVESTDDGIEIRE